jgi:hypothetical protein
MNPEHIAVEFAATFFFVNNGAKAMKRTFKPIASPVFEIRWTVSLTRSELRCI